MRGFLRLLRAQAGSWLGISARQRQRLDGSRAVVLMYHRVLPEEEVRALGVEPGMYVTPTTFGRHLDWLQEEFRVLPLHEIVRRLGDGDSLPAGACAITFDDGWRDNYDYALPELAKRGLAATIFVVADRVGTDGAFWPDEVLRRMLPLSAREQTEIIRQLGVKPQGDFVGALLRHLKAIPEAGRPFELDRLRAMTPAPEPDRRELLDWEQLDELARAGIDIESHGSTHSILTGLPADHIELELRSARERLEARSFGRHRLLAYPSGAHNDRVREIARRVGYSAAFTTEPGLLAERADPMRLPRLGIHDDVSTTRAEFLRYVPGPK